MLTRIKKLELVTVTEKSSIRETIEVIDRGVIGVALVVDDDFKLIGTVTDGDIRRSILKNASLDESIGKFMCLNPIKADVGISHYQLISMMKSMSIEQIPIVDGDNKLVDVKTLAELIKKEDKENYLIIMAGGLGTRLQPLTNATPKPLLPIGHKPILESIIEHARLYGLTNIIISINYLSESIKKYFGDGSSFGVKLHYVEEKENSGTAGSISLIDKIIDKDAFVINGDILSKIDFDEMLSRHKQNSNCLTVGTRVYTTQIPYGIIKQNGEDINGLEEKPTLEYIINAGVYLLSPDAIRLIPSNTFFHMTHLIEKLIENNMKVGSFLIEDYWLDIGKINDYYKANIEFSDYFL